MRLEEWLPWYNLIAEKLGLSIEKDLAATHHLSTLIARNHLTPPVLRKRLQNQRVIVAGAGPSLLGDLKELQHHSILSSSVHMAADGAAAAFLEMGLTPHIVVTDLDGPREVLLEAQRKGALMVVHGHGDNIPALNAYSELFSKPVLGTTQVYPARYVYNFGGFTDGDRCVFLCDEMRCGEVILIGMDFGSIVGEYSKPQAALTPEKLRFKREKLKIGRQLLTWLASRARCPIFNATSSSTELQNIPKYPCFAGFNISQ